MIRVTEKFPAHNKSNCCCYHFRYRIGQPEILQAEARENISERHEQEHRSYYRQHGAFEACSDRLEKHGICQRCYERDKAYPNYAECIYSDRNDLLISREEAEHRFGNYCKAERSEEHQCHSENDRLSERFFASVDVS